MTKYVRKPDGVFRDEKTGRLMEHRGLSKRIFWSRQMIDDLCRHFPTTTNDELAELFGMCKKTILRKARELGLEKDPEWLLELWNSHRHMALVVSKKMGNPGCIKKGMHLNPATEFKPGRQVTEEQKRKRKESLRITTLRHPEISKERGRKISETKRRLAEEKRKHNKKAV